MTPPSDDPDLDLLRQMRSGMPAAFQALYQRHQGPLFRFATLRSGSADTAADIVQEVFMGLLTDSFKFDPLRGALRHFLFGVARKLILRHEAPRQRLASLDSGNDVGSDDDKWEEQLSDGLDAPLERLLSNEVAEDVRRALTLLPPPYRDAVILYEMHDLSYLEIAGICNVDIGTVRSRLSRGRAALVKRLGAHRPAALAASN